MILAGPCRLPAGTVVRVILPILREVFITTRHRNCGITRKMTGYLSGAWSDEAVPAKAAGVILLTFTA
jgi:hypothetical protein